MLRRRSSAQVLPASRHRRQARSAAPRGAMAVVWALLVLPALLAPARGQTPPEPVAERPASTAAAQPAPQGRPRIGLVLSGGGARGLTHVGVLKVLEREHVPVDVIAGTSMGAIIGGLYASGMKADDIERELGRVDWARLFASRVSRQQLSQRRKEEDFELATAIELGFRDGEFRAPQGAVSSRGLETLLRRYTLPVRSIDNFDKLPIPFRAVATDMETGEPLVLGEGDLAMALRSSMSVPGVFPSTELGGRVLGDGGLVNNVPVDVARAMGADVLIVVNIGTPLAKRETLNSAIGLTTQMIRILTEQNVRRSLASLTSRDLLIAPDLGALASGDFEKTRDFIAIGSAGAEKSADRLRALALPAEAYADWRRSRHAVEPPAPTISFVAYEGTTLTNPQRLEPQLQTRPGETFDPAKAARDTLYFAASGDYVRADYRLIETEAGTGMLFDLEDKPWGPDYINIGLDLSTDLSAHSAFNVKLSHNRHWLTPNGTEWRNRLQIGEVPALYTELYHPLKWTLGLSNDWFLSSYLSAERRTQSIYRAQTADEIGQIRRSTGVLGLDLGQPWGNLGELRFGLMHRVGKYDPVLVTATSLAEKELWTETLLRARVIIDQLDFANFPQRGYRAEAQIAGGRAHYAGDESRLARVEAQAGGVMTWGADTFSLSGQVRAANAVAGDPLGQYSLGGFQQLSGYQKGQITGNALVFGRLGWYRRLSATPVFARGFFVGASLEAGNAWSQRQDLRLTGLRGGGSLYLGADTGLGPMYLGMTWAPRGEPGLALFIGRP